MRKKKSTQQLVGIESVTDSSVLTAGGELTFYLVQPTNLNVLPESGVRTRVTALLNVLKTSAEMELLALDAKESYQDNRLYYRRRTEEEGNPAIRALLAQDRRHLDDVQTMMASSRQFCFVLRRRKTNGAINFTTVEQQLRDSGFTVQRAEGQALLELLAIYFEQDATHEAFSLLDSATGYVNQKAEEGSLDPVQVKAVFFALCFGDNVPTRAAADRFVDCFYKTETRTRMVTVTQEDGTEELVEETYEVAVPLSVEDVYEKLTTWRGSVVTDAERSNAVDIYAMVMGSMGGDTFNGAYEPGGSAPIELDVSMLTDPTTKNAADLVVYVTNAWNSGWGYVWGTYGQTLTSELLQYKLTQYPDGVGKYAAFIRANWLGRHTADCVGLIKGYGWLSTDTMTIDYGTHGMPDIGANEMFYNATRRGGIETMPDTPGLAVWKAGHIGVYIGNGEVIEAMGTKYGVVKTQLEGRGWTHWLEVPGIEYE